MQSKAFKYISFVMIIAVMAVIFAFSNRPASESVAESNIFSLKIIDGNVDDYEDMDAVQKQAVLDYIDWFVRKTAHVLEFAALSFWIYLHLFAVRSKTFERGRIFSWRMGLLSAAASLVYAGTDEIHQLFVSGRTCTWMDIGIDSIGCVLGVPLAVLVIAVWRKVCR